MGAAVLIDVRNGVVGVDEVLQSVRHPGAGGVVLFIGTVRDNNDGRAVSALEYEAYESMARTEMRRIADEIASDQPQVRLSVVHRVGALQVGDIAIVCAASAPHREQAFDACRALIDRIKERVPVWKREHGPDGGSWVGWSGPDGSMPPSDKERP
ncbi:MAG: molybdenum cofactor biosynthesis protein MoaE [Deltaproteobacteria bacterium]|nr:molybdenum cofactor biosynthesis protein MoaE [Deltaproteobacteria bacterium]